MTRHAALFLVIGVLWGRAGDALPLPAGFGERPSDLRVRLVTVGPGAEANAFFGHSALWVEDTRLGEQVLYSYGMTFFGKAPPLAFLVRPQTFWAGRLPVDFTFEQYRKQDRAIIARELSLTVEQRRRLLALLERDVRPENRDYPYHVTDNNCATRVRDVLDEAMGGALRSASSGPARLTQRQHLRRYTRARPLWSLLLLTVMGPALDAPMTRWKEAFLPLELAGLLDEVHVTGGEGGSVLLVSRRFEVAMSGAGAVPGTGDALGWASLLVGLGVAAGAVLLARLRHRTWGRVLFGLYLAGVGVVAGAVGTGLLVLAFSAELDLLRGNANLLLLDPVALVLLPLGLGMASGHRGAECWARRCVALLLMGALLAAGLAVLPGFVQDTREPVLMMLVAWLGLGVALARSRDAAPSRAPASEALAREDGSPA